MRLKIACLLMRWLLELVVLMFSADRAKDKVTPEPRAPDGYEWIYVLSGHMRLVLGDSLGPGEVVEFDTDVPHWFGSTGNEPAEILSISGRPGERMKVADHTRRAAAGC